MTEKKEKTSKDDKIKASEKNVNYSEVLEARSQRGVKTHQKAFAIQSRKIKEEGGGYHG